MLEIMQKGNSSYSR